MLEVIVVMAMFVIVAGFGLFVSMETFRASNFHSDRSLLIATLQRARAEAMSNICDGTCTDGKAHGVHIGTNEYVLFQGSTFNASDAQNVTFEANQSVTRTGDTDIVFSQLTANTTGYTITLNGNGRTSVISIAANGQITWTN
jgi:Tfp pilus assembly protein FimT